MKTVSRQDIEAWGGSDPYYTGRVPYLAAAADIIARIPGERALEIGPYRHCLVPDCETMDMDRGLPGITYYHDAGVTPWPVPDGQPYDLILAFQVWEHLGGRQREASIEAFRTARCVLLSFPYLWPGTDEHANIDRCRIAHWTCARDPILTLRIASDYADLA